MKRLIIIGASGFGREVAWLVERINAHQPEWDLIGFIDDNQALWGTEINGYPILGGCASLSDYTNAWVVCAVGASAVRKRIIERVTSGNPDIRFATLIDPSVEMSRFVTIGEGSILCAHTIMTVNVTIGRHVVINLDCTVGHDDQIEDYTTVYPSVNISGNVQIGEAVELGTGTQIIQGKNIGQNTIIGAGSVVIQDIPARCTAVGIPAKVIKYAEG